MEYWDEAQRIHQGFHNRDRWCTYTVERLACGCFASRRVTGLSASVHHPRRRGNTPESDWKGIEMTQQMEIGDLAERQLLSAIKKAKELL